jgi:GT2 family glycosyltransferase
LREAPPAFWSRRFCEVFLLALRTDKVGALAGLYWALTRRRIRGWSKLIVTAAANENAYAWWIDRTEPRVADRLRAAHPKANGPSVVPLIVEDEGNSPPDVARTISSVRTAFGHQAPIYGTTVKGASGDVIPAVSRAAAVGDALLPDLEDSSWVFPIVGGETISPLTNDLLPRFLSQQPHAALAYWDEDRLVGGRRGDPWIKPDWDPDLFGRCGGLAGASAVRLGALRGALGQAGGNELGRSALDRVLFAIAEGAETGPAVHLPFVLTHRSRRVQAPSTSELAPDPDRWPSVSVMIPTRDRADLLATCLRGLERLSYPGEIELLIIDNGTIDPAALALIEHARETPTVRVIRDDRAFNFSRLNNVGALEAAGEFLCLLNNDVEALDGDWLTQLVRHAIRPRVGAAGALLLYPSGKIQHAGVAVGIGGAAGHVQKGVDPAADKFGTWHRVTREVSAVTAAAMVVRKETFVQAGGFDENAFAVAFNDVDLCLRLKQKGYRNIFVAEAKLIHHESESRGDDRLRRNAARFASELAHLQERWRPDRESDPHFSPLFSRLVEPCVLDL